jgi:fructoselysine-6-P-deglycase FrlB-like protein
VIDAGVQVDALFGAGAEAAFTDIDAVLILASGTSFYAGLVARYWIEGLARVPCNVELGHEYRYRDSIPNPRQLVVTISQSGETLDTMEALKRASELGHAATLSICNVHESAIPRASRFVFYTRAGAEIGVASTKAFTTQLVSLFTLTLAIAKAKGLLTRARSPLPSTSCASCLEASSTRSTSSRRSRRGRSASRPRACALPRPRDPLPGCPRGRPQAQGNLLHPRRGVPAGELKHGPLALVDAEMPVVVIAPNDGLLEKVKSNMQEVRARGGELYVFADLDSHFSESVGVHVIRAPRHAGPLSPIVHTIPVQLLAYHTALRAAAPTWTSPQPRQERDGRVGHRDARSHAGHPLRACGRRHESRLRRGGERAPPLVRPPNWLTHIEHERLTPIWGPWIERLEPRHTLYRYDSRGCGLSTGIPARSPWNGWCGTSKRWSTPRAWSASPSSGSRSEARLRSPTPRSIPSV